jgi:hypothetical protein
LGLVPHNSWVKVNPSAIESALSLERNQFLTSITIPRLALFDVTSLFVPEIAYSGNTVELKIVIDDADLNIRELSAYLAIIDEVYGRFAHGGLRSYVQDESKQLRIEKLKQGSLEVYIVELVTRATDAWPLIIVFLFLKYLPNVADTYKKYEEGRLIRERRKKLRAAIKQDHTMKQLSPRRVNQLVILLDDLRLAEHEHLPSATKFAVRHVKSLQIGLREEEE